MCAKQPHGTPQETLKNLKKTMPLGRKLRLFLRNNWIKMRAVSSCCGNYGEPGC
jgi:hypothetical protein